MFLIFKYKYIFALTVWDNHVSVSALKCYECSNLVDTKCGLLWGFKGDEAETYLHDCDEAATSCNKFVGERQGIYEPLEAYFGLVHIFIE